MTRNPQDEERLAGRGRTSPGGLRVVLGDLLASAPSLWKPWPQGAALPERAVVVVDLELQCVVARMDEGEALRERLLAAVPQHASAEPRWVGLGSGVRSGVLVVAPRRQDARLVLRCGHVTRTASWIRLVTCLPPAMRGRGAGRAMVVCRTDDGYSFHGDPFSDQPFLAGPDQGGPSVDAGRALVIAEQPSSNPQDEERLARREAGPSQRRPWADMSWTREWIRGDQWLSEEMARYAMAEPSIWNEAQAVGDVWRLRRRRPEHDRALLAAVTSGQRRDDLEPWRAWALRLPADDAAGLERRALAEAQALERRLDEATQFPHALSDAGWARSVCHQRDRLESVLLVLQAAGHGQQLREAVVALDRRGLGMVRAATGVWPTWDDDRLERAAELAGSVGHPAWWATDPFGLLDVEDQDAQPNPQDEERLARRTSERQAGPADWCPHCGGVGTVAFVGGLPVFKAPDSCQDCGGRGETEDGECPGCAGEGVYPVEDCAACGGSGRAGPGTVATNPQDEERLARRSGEAARPDWRVLADHCWGKLRAIHGHGMDDRRSVETLLHDAVQATRDRWGHGTRLVPDSRVLAGAVRQVAGYLSNAGLMVPVVVQRSTSSIDAPAVVAWCREPKGAEDPDLAWQAQAAVELLARVFGMGPGSAPRASVVLTARATLPQPMWGPFIHGATGGPFTRPNPQDEERLASTSALENPRGRRWKLLDVRRSSRPGKKLAATFEDRDSGARRTTHFGATGYSDFTMHRDPERRERYLARHGRGREDWNDPTTPGALSRWLLWNKPTLAASLRDFRRRFGLGRGAATNPQDEERLAQRTAEGSLAGARPLRFVTLSFRREGKRTRETWLEPGTRVRHLRVEWPHGQVGHDGASVQGVCTFEASMDGGRTWEEWSTYEDLEDYVGPSSANPQDEERLARRMARPVRPAGPPALVEVALGTPGTESMLEFAGFGPAQQNLRSWPRGPVRFRLTFEDGRVVTGTFHLVPGTGLDNRGLTLREYVREVLVDLATGSSVARPGELDPGGIGIQASQAAAEARHLLDHYGLWDPGAMP